MNLHDLAGVLGVALVLLAYALLQLGRIDHHAPRYSALNLAGAALILASLAYDFNLPSVLMEGTWALISAYGLLLALRRRRAPGPIEPT